MSRGIYTDFQSVELGNVRDDFIPAASYTAPAILALEKEKLWPKVWHLVCREQEIPEVDDFVTYDIFGESVVVVRTGAGEIRAFFNVCMHRGRRLCDDEQGKLSGGFFCPYHGWRYASQDGKLIHVPHVHDWEGSESPFNGRCDLRQVRVALWGGFVWINMDPDAEPLTEHLADISGLLEPFELENCRISWHKSLIVPVGWKSMMEAFMEGYHSEATHRLGMDYATLSSPSRVFGKHSAFYSLYLGNPSRRGKDGKWIEMKDLREQLSHSAEFLNQSLHALFLEPGVAATRRLMTDVKKDAKVEEILHKYWEFHREELEARGVVWPEGLTEQFVFSSPTDCHLFPNVIILPSIDGALCYRVRPLGADAVACRFDVWCLGRYAPGQEPDVGHQIYDLESFKGQNPFLEEDFSNLVAVNKGMKSKGWPGAVLNPVQERMVSNFHKILHQYLRA